MVLYFTITDKVGQFREAFLPIDQEEVAFELLNRIVADGHCIRDAYLLEKDSRIKTSQSGIQW